MKAKKITKATIKSFIRKNSEKLYIKNINRFDCTIDCLSSCESVWYAPTLTSECVENTLGFSGIWLVDGSRNYFSKYENNTFVGYEVSNCCGNFYVGVKK